MGGSYSGRTTGPAILTNLSHACLVGRVPRVPNAIRWSPRSLALAAVVVSFAAILVIGGWNAAKYPITLGYDYNSNADYMHVVLTDHRLPHADETAEANQPPLYYLVGGLAARAGHAVFGWDEEPTTDLPEHSYRGAQILNVVFVLLTALLLFALARLAAPDAPVVWASALAFFAFLPVVSKTEAMLHAETMNMLLSTAAVVLTMRIVTSEFRLSLFLLLLVDLAADLATRASAIFTVAAVALALAVAFVPRIDLRTLARRAVPIAAVLIAIVGAGVWFHQGAHIGTLASIGAPGVPGAKTHFFDLPVKALFETPFRTHYTNAAFAITYTEIWGDWLGSFAWSTFLGSPTGTTLAALKDQSWIGVIPTALALVGYGFLAALAVRVRRDLLAAALVPPIAIAGYLIRSYEHLSPDGDVFKASYILTTAPIWALCFGLAFWKLGRFRIVQVGVGCALAVFAVLELRFVMFGLRYGHPVF